MINSAANKRLELLCMVTHWLRAMLRYVVQPLPGPPPEGRTKYRTSPGDEGRDEGDQASDIHECVDGYSFHSISSGVFEGDRNNKQLVIAGQNHREI